MNLIERFIAKCVCKGIELYFKKYRLATIGHIEIIPLDKEGFEKHLLNVFQNNSESVRNYLANAPTTAPQVEQTTK